MGLYTSEFDCAKVFVTRGFGSCDIQRNWYDDKSYNNKEKCGPSTDRQKENEGCCRPAMGSANVEEIQNRILL